ncbi:MAG: right-handed parallel beta-helix repeat-containing protein [Candidatus Latescibacteria bacterium]|nr:right-handed parallel beta-helix repeat-containing protein [Candidatus Latescibacterota bacterium]
MKPAREPLLLYLAPEGSDCWSGALPQPNAEGSDGPLATLTGARHALRRLRLREGLQQPVEVLLRGGTYPMHEPLRLWGGDAGTAQCPITYAAYPGEKPVLSGSRPFTSWQPYRDGIYCAWVPELRSGQWWFRQLFYRGKRMLRSRWPKRDPADPLYGGWAFVESPVEEENSRPEVPVAFRWEGEGPPRRWAKPAQGEVFIVLGRSWVNDIIPIKEVDFEQRLIRLARASRPYSPSLNVATRLLKGNRFYVENLLEDLTEPGEWCLDTDTGTVYFRPPEEGAFDAEAVSAPATERLVQLIGTPEHPLRHVALRGLTFTQTLAGFPHPDAYYKTPNAAPAVYLEDTEDCAVEDCCFDAVGGDAIRLQNCNTRARITGNEIAYAGAYGIFVGSFQRGFARHDTRSGDSPSPPEWYTNLEDQEATVLAWPKSREHLIADNHIHHVGVYEKHACGICFFGVSCIDTTVCHNHIHHVPRFGIGLLSGFGRVIVEYNELHHLSEETCDTGGICSNRWYTYERDAELAQGCIVRFNRVRDVIGCGAYDAKAEPGGSERAGGKVWTPYYSWAIYFDNAPMHTQVYGNICARNTLGGIMISHWGKDVVVENNVFVDSGQSQAYMLFAGRMSGIRLRRNIFAYSNPRADFMRLNLAKDADLQAIFAEVDHNLYFPPPGRVLTFSGLPGEAVERAGLEEVQRVGRDLAGWKALGFDQHSVVADPLFIDPENDNYDLKPGSPALALGFVPIDTSRIGPRRRQEDRG